MNFLYSLLGILLFLGLFCRVIVQVAIEKYCGLSYQASKPLWRNLASGTSSWASWDELRNKIKHSEWEARLWFIFYVFGFHLAEQISLMILSIWLEESFLDSDKKYDSYYEDYYADQFVTKTMPVIVIKAVCVCMLTLYMAWKFPTFVYARVFEDHCHRQQIWTLYTYIVIPEIIMFSIVGPFLGCGRAKPWLMLVMIGADWYVTYYAYWTMRWRPPAYNLTSFFRVKFLFTILMIVPYALLWICWAWNRLQGEPDVASPPKSDSPLRAPDHPPSSPPPSNLGVTRDTRSLLGTETTEAPTARKFFISHKQDESSAIASDLWYNLGKNEQVWLDVKNPMGQNKEDMMLGIEECEIFICILSQKYMKSNFCLLELREAIRLQKKILMAYNTDSVAKREIGDLFKQAEEAGISAKDWPSAFPISRGNDELKSALKTIRKYSKKPTKPIELIN